MTDEVANDWRSGPWRHAGRALHRDCRGRGTPRLRLAVVCRESVQSRRIAGRDGRRAGNARP